VHSTNAWIVTGGTDVGVMKLVGDVRRCSADIFTTLIQPPYSLLKMSSPRQVIAQDSRQMQRCIGIASWGVVQGRGALSDSEEHESEACDHGSECPGSVARPFEYSGECGPGEVRRDDDIFSATIQTPYRLLRSAGRRR
jgi:hypothetical protein